jgi:AraC-like DNA-binding protein
MDIEGDELLLQAAPRTPGLCFETQDLWAALLMRLMRSAWNGELRPRELELCRPLPGGGDGPFRAVFGCPIRFDCPLMRFHFDLATMRQPLLGANRELAQHNDQIAMAYLAKLERDDIVNRVRTHLLNGLSAGVFGRAEIAARMHMSPSTLQAKLARRGVSFQQVLDGTREELALGYVTQRRLSITEIAFMLGFSDVSNFNRAFRRWTGKAPTEYRGAGR